MMNIVALICFAVICELIGFLGSLPTMRAIPTWYARLRRPAWTPPNRVFAPVWTLLYLLMAIAGWRCWLVSGFSAWTAPFVIQLALNLAWSWIFFGFRQLGVAVAEIVVLWICIAWCIFSMSTVDKIAAYLLVPYILWVAYAATLNAGFWWMNRDPREPGHSAKA